MEAVGLKKAQNKKENKMSLASLDWGSVFGGFGIFMFGINFMGDGLKAAAGEKMRTYIDKYTSSPLSAMLIGFILTVIMQSSSASIAITIGLVRAGLMTFPQAAGIVFGANIGTTVTSFLISLDIGKYVMWIMFVGTMLICFGKKKKTKNYGNIILGFGLLFFGMETMGNALAGLKELPQFESIAVSMSDTPWLAMLTGAAMTGVVQSSAATIGIVQRLYAAGAIDLQAALPFMFGANVGTTVTGLLAAMGGSLSGRRTATLHTGMNIVATLIGMLILTPYTNFIASLNGLNPMMQIAVANIIFKTVTTFAFLPFINKMCALVEKIVPGTEPARLEVNVDSLDPKLVTTLPAAALDAAGQAIEQMASAVKQDMRETQDFLNKRGGEEERDALMQNEQTINTYDQKIMAYLNRIQTEANLGAGDIEHVRMNMEVVKNLERAGDLAVNLNEFFTMVFDADESFSPTAQADINDMFKNADEMIDQAMIVFRTHDAEDWEKLLEEENMMDEMEYAARQGHFARMGRNECTPIAGSVYVDILGTLERIGDHICNIGKSAHTHMEDDISPDEPVAKTA